eukprot:gene9840-10684_t
MEVPIENNVSAKVYKNDPVRRMVLIAILIAMYAVSLPFCYYTAGEPRRIAMIQAQKIADEKWAAEILMLHTDENNATSSTNNEDNTFTNQIVYEDDNTLSSNNQMFAEMNAAGVATDLTSSGVYTGSVDEFSEESGDLSSTSTKTEGAASSSFLAGWLGPTKEQRRQKAEFDKWQKEFQEKSGESVSLPPEYLPSAWACLALFLCISLHALFHLMCHWVVSFKALTLYQPATKVEEGCFVLIVPPANRGSAALVPVKKSSTAGIATPFAEFQRLKYIYLPPNKLGDQAKKYPKGVFTLSSYPINLPISHYLTSSGITSEGEISKLTEKWGKNHLAVAIPSFLELLQIQLLSPLAIFQVFCAILWLLDEYWTYTLFSLFSVVMYEATTVFQRTRTQQMLGGMSPKPSPIYAFRAGKWTIISTKDLLPGDLISLSFKKRAVNRPTPVAIAPAPGTTVANTSAKEEKKDEPEEKHIPVTSKDEIIPCDCVLVKGSAVVNEASLTGESVPQMKEAIARSEKSAASEEEEKYDMNGEHRVHTLFAGSSIVTVTGRTKSDVGDDESISSSIPAPPDDGAIAYVVRTGFGSSQGALLQMIEYSQQSVSGDIKETGLALFLLFIFAILASGYVLKEGLRKKEKTTHELLLKCVIIITSVVPRQFPMQMAVAVNMALMSLSKAGIFCTEPYRVPLAGKVSHCLFDKTGTITTDQLVPVGIINYNSTSTTAGEDSLLNAALVDDEDEDGKKGKKSEEEDDDITEFEKSLPNLSPVTTACAETALILAACHSLVVIDDDDNKGTDANNADMSSTPLPATNLTGDPIELAAIRAIDWHWDGPSSTASPDGAVRRHMYGLQIALNQKKRLLALPTDQRGPNHDKEIEHFNKEIRIFENKIELSKRKASQALYNNVQVLQRHHFSSALQRMSVIVKCNNRGVKSSNATTSSSSSSSSEVTSSSSGDHWYCLVKGSPEALRKLILPEQLPSWYSQTYEALARRGLRVLALAYKKVSGKDRPVEQPRHWVESNLFFGGFIAFECKIRADSTIVIQSLLQSDHKVAMLTGDALLTSLHVAKQVGICQHGHGWSNVTLDGERNDKNQIIATSKDQFYWKIISDHLLPQGTDEAKTRIPFKLEDIPTLVQQKYNLLTTEDVFLAYIQLTGNKTSLMWNYSRFFKVFARMSPQGKANIIKSIQDTDKDFHVFMCGDGGNDVGALKQADIGLALLSGHANANTSEELGKEVVVHEGNNNKKKEESGKAAEDILNEHQKKLQARSEELNKARMAHMKEFQAKFTREQQVLLQEEIRKRTEKGDYMAMWTLMKDQATRVKQAMAEENQRFMAMHGQVWDPKRDGDGMTKSTIEELMDGMDTSSSAGGLPVVRPGDASVAAPFTSRIPSIRAVVDLIRQGRCTLLSALMQQQIMMLESTISAYTLSSLSLHNARSSERQMMASSWLILTAAVSFSYASPVDHMHPLRPLRSLFHPAVFISMLGQAAIHIACMTLAVQWATDAMGEEKLKEVTEFFRKVKANEIDRSAHCGEEDLMCQFQAYWMAPFLPNLLNSVVFLVETSQMISVFFANYKGRPWMKGILENHALFLSVFLCVTGVIIAAWELIPQANELIQLAPFPDDAFRYKVVFLVISTILGTIAWDRFCIFLFAPDVFWATWKEFKKTTIADFIPIFKTFLLIVGCLIILGTGNLLLAGAAYWWYRSYYANKPTTA